jgi:hypothetical protein
MPQCLRSIRIILLLVLLLSCVGCAGILSGKWALITPDAQVKKSLESFQLNSDYNYFYSGSDAYPRSILGLSNAYTLNSDIWVKIEFTPKTLSEMVSSMQTQATNHFQSQNGFVILDNNGQQIGIWYSIMVRGMSLKILDNKNIIVYPPNDEEYRGYEDRFNKR